MSQREEVDRQRIERFLMALGQRFRQAGRIYLVGGTTLVWEGLRAQTIDIDIAYDIAAADASEFMRTVQTLKRELNINVEEASPGDFIPLPAGYRERSQFVGRYGTLDVFHFDPYSTALSKIERGRDEDLSDVIMLLKNGNLQMDRLVAYFEEILPRVEAHSLKSDPVEFQRKFTALQRMWQTPPSTPSASSSRA